MLTKRDIQIASLLGSQALTEASLGRMYQHYLRSGEQSWAVISAAQSSVTPEQNQTNDKRLKGWLSQRGFGNQETKQGYFQVVGWWTETDPVTKEPMLDPKTGKKKQAYELSYFVIGMSQEQAMQGMGEFKQQAVLYAGPETQGKVSVIFSDGSVKVLSKFTPQAVGDAYSQIRNKTFTFEALELSVLPSGHIEAMAYQATKKAIDEGAIQETSLRELDLKLKTLRW